MRLLMQFAVSPPVACRSQHLSLSQLLKRSDRYSAGDSCLTPAKCYFAPVLTSKAFTQKGSSKKKGTSRGTGKKEEWHGLSLEEKNEIVSTEIEIYQAAIERVGLGQGVLGQPIV